MSDLSWDQEQISNVTVLLYQPIDDSTGYVGTGTIISQNSRYFLLTADHIALKMKDDATLVLRLDGDIPLKVNLKSLIENNSFNWQSHQIADIALIELKPTSKDLLQRLQQWSFPINQIYGKKNRPPNKGGLTFLGFPILDLNLEYFSPLIFEANLAGGLLTQRRYDTNTSCNFFFLSEPSIEGCSGSGVYFSVKTGFYFKSSSGTLLVGIMHGTHGDNTGGKLAAVTPSYYIYDLLGYYFNTN